MADDVLVWSPTLDPPRSVQFSLRQLVRPLLRATPIALVLTIVGAVHAINMFDSPFYFDDEGIYMSQAWSFITSGKLAPYTYFYDHPPLGWFTLAFVIKLFGGFGFYGEAVNSGRVVMLIAHLISTFLVYRIACRLGGKEAAGLIAALLFGLSPFQIIFGRQVLLDNLAVLWLLAAIYLATSDRLSIGGALLSGAAMGIAVLNKEIVVPLFPGMLVLLWFRLHPEIRIMGIATWLFTTIGIASFYPLYALLKGELFPYGSKFDFGSSPHVSLIDGIMFHQNRASDLGLLDTNSLFWNAERLWWRTDPALVVGVLGAIAVSVLLQRRHRGSLGLGVMLIGLLAFLARGGVVFEFWLLIGVPIAAIILGLAIDDARQTVTRLLSLVVRPPKVVRELSGDFRRMLSDEITDSQFLHYVGLAVSSRFHRLRKFVSRLIPAAIQRLGADYRRMLRGDISEGQFFSNIGRGLQACCLRMLSIPWTAQDFIIGLSEKAGRRVDTVLHSSDESSRATPTPGPRRDLLRASGALAVTVAFIATVGFAHNSYADSYERAFQQNETGPQVQAIHWFKVNANRNDFLVIDSYAYVDLRGFKDAHPFWKVDLDPDVRDDILGNDWRGIDYVALTPVMNSAVADGRLPLVAKALEHSDVIQRFESSGEWLEIRRVDHPERSASASHRDITTEN